MNRHVNSIAGRMSLRPPQRRSLKILDRITEIAPLGKEAEINAVLEIIRSEFPSVTDFEREFPSLCFALATGVTAVDRLNIVAHDKFQEIIEEANKPDSAIRLQALRTNEREVLAQGWARRYRRSAAGGLCGRRTRGFR